MRSAGKRTSSGRPCWQSMTGCASFAARSPPPGPTSRTGPRCWPASSLPPPWSCPATRICCRRKRAPRNAETVSQGAEQVISAVSELRARAAALLILAEASAGDAAGARPAARTAHAIQQAREELLNASALLRELPGPLRAQLLAAGQAVEAAARLTPPDSPEPARTAEPQSPGQQQEERTARHAAVGTGLARPRRRRGGPRPGCPDVGTAHPSPGYRPVRGKPRGDRGYPGTPRRRALVAINRKHDLIYRT